MKLPDENDYYDKGRGIPIAYAIGGVSVFVFLILAVVFFSNSQGNNRNAVRSPNPNPTAHNINDNAISQTEDSQLRVEDLSFWDLFPERDEDLGLGNEEVTPEQPVYSPSPEPLDPSEDGRHTFVERRNGTSEWVPINPFITRNNYDPLGFILRRDRMAYFEFDKPVSYLGIDVSRQNGRLDFNRIKSAGVDFVMLRVGARGYETGHITIDEDFSENLKAAVESGLNVGVYFFSQAINEAEATEEASLVIEMLAEEKITYPVVFHMDFIAFDSSRIDRLTRTQKTEITATFCNYMSGAGYTPMIYGNKEWLIEQIDLTKLMEYDIWLSQPGDLPDYPYKFQVWQYSFTGSVSGVTGNVNMNISFVDYTAR
ncbi:MAG: glycoside hydrolase family 25 protein [Lachnospiraceae bacterium]|nr:glycoside hydrolase family 25 protein [Lachnospiraceae bacterium]